VLVATLNVNVAANVVSPANDFSNLYPKRISFKIGGILTCFVGLLLQPWRWLASHGSFVMGWLVGYSSFLGPIAGVMIADYYVVRRRRLATADLFERGGIYEYSRGFHWGAIVALVAGIAVALAGLVVRQLRGLYPYAWFVGFGVSFIVYLLVTPRLRPGAGPATAATGAPPAAGTAPR
ncbi:MAG: cytosine permease, partial [Candidatus Acidiferrales bacterium]